MDDFYSLIDDQCKVPLVSFGVLTDVQYADRDDAQSWYCAEKIRYYRSSLDHIRKAFRTWETGEHRVHFVMQLGDLFDACNRTLNLDSDAAARKSLEIFDEFPKIPTYHVLGNHEVDNFGRKVLAEYFHSSFERLLEVKTSYNNTSQESAIMDGPQDLKSVKSEGNSLNGPLAHYKLSPVPGIVVIVLDCFDISLSGYDVDHPKYKKALEILCKFHTHEDKVMWDYDDHLEGMDKRFLAYNGAIDTDQLDWLDHELEMADRNRQKVIICGHIALVPESSNPTCVLWNYEDVLGVVHRHNCVVAYLAGHLHDNGYALDSYGIHHVTFAGIIEVHPKDSSFSTVHVFADRLEIVGFGREKNYVLHFKTPMMLNEPEQCMVSIEVPVQA